MKHLIILSFLFVSLSFTTKNPKKIKLAQVVYKIGMYEIKEKDVNSAEKLSDLDKNDPNKFALFAVNAMDKAMEKVEFELIFNEKVGLYKSIERTDNDMGYDLLKIMYGGESLYYKNLETNKKIEQVNHQGQLLNVKDRQYEWNITNETKKIGNYTCYKATTEYDEENKFKGEGVVNRHRLEVWFTPEIPVSFGPMGYDGLPGLVLEANRGGNKYIYAAKIDLKYKHKNQKIDIAKGGKEIDDETYINLLLEQRKSLTNQ